MRELPNWLVYSEYVFKHPRLSQSAFFPKKRNMRQYLRQKTRSSCVSACKSPIVSYRVEGVRHESTVPRTAQSFLDCIRLIGSLEFSDNADFSYSIR